ncbi:MAG: WG repeat-containing protein [Phycisphaerales bacterium]
MLAIIAAALLIYPVSLAWIHTNNARCRKAWDQLQRFAMSHGIPIRPTPDGTGLTRFYDETQPIRMKSGWTSHMQGFKDSAGETRFPAVFRYCDQTFCEGLAFVVDADGRSGYIRPDGTWAFSVNFDHAAPFVNGLAHVRNEIPSDLITPVLRSGFIDTEGNVVIPVQYEAAEDCIGEFVLVHDRTWFSPICDHLLDGLDIDPGLGWLLPDRLLILDKTGNQCSPRQVRNWIAATD